MGAALAGRYITDTDQFLAVTDEKSLIESAYDLGGPLPADTFAELSPEVRDAVTTVIEEALADGESMAESFGAGTYSIPYNPVDPLVRTIALRWTWISLRERHGKLTQEQADDARESIRGFGDRIGDGRIVLVSTRLGDASATGQAEVYSWGSAERQFSREQFGQGTVGRNVARKRPVW